MIRKTIWFIFTVFLIVLISSGFTNAARPYAGVVLNALMEAVPDTDVIEELLPEFEKKTGIKVNFEKVQYMTMHEKLVPQLIAPEGSGSYDFLEVDNYWVGEFVSGGWLFPIDDRIASTPSVSLENYIPSLVDLVGVVDGVAYMLPMWTYPFGLVYRKDIVDSPEFQNAYQQKFGRPWRIPQSVPEYAEVVKLAKEVTPPGVYGCAMQAARIDPIVMEWINYLFSMGGDVYDRTTWEPVINNEAGVKALEIYVDLVKNAAQPGATGSNFDDMANVFSQGRAVFAIAHNFLMFWLEDPTVSKVAGKIEFTVMPGGRGQLGAWGWAIPKSSPNPDAAWEFISWVESKEIAYKRAMAGGMPTQGWIYDDPEFLKKYPWQKVGKKIIAQAKPLPIISRSTQMVEIIGENLSAAVIGELTPREALDRAARQLAELAEEDPMIQKRLASK